MSSEETSRKGAKPAKERRKEASQGQASFVFSFAGFAPLRETFV
jgi:hypothetical protein